jgi:SAM-dependent methyltransferase
MGRDTVALADRGLVVEGLDLSQELLQRFREFDGGRYAIPLHCADIVDPPEELTRRFDAVAGFFTLHHLHDLRACFRSMLSFVKPGGRIVFLEPNPFNPLFYIQMLIVPGMNWGGDKGLVKMRPRHVFHEMEAAGLGACSLQRFGFFPPFVTNRAGGLRAEAAFERVGLWRPVLPFQLFRGDVGG